MGELVQLNHIAVELEGEERLAAIRFTDYTECALGRVKRRLSPVAKAWVENDSNGTGSFNETCTKLGFNPEYIRRLYKRALWQEEAMRAERRHRFALIQGGRCER